MPGNKLTIGNVDIYGIADTVRWSDRPLDETFPSDYPVDWDEQARRYPDTFGEGMTWREDFGCYLVRSQGRTLLVDTGVGPASSAFARNLGHGGELLQKLGSIGVGVEDVDIVVFTHLHPDHVGWNTIEEGGKRLPTFPKARYIVQKADWDAVQGNEASPRRPYVDDMLVPLESVGVLELIDIRAFDPTDAWAHARPHEHRGRIR
jgi:glyoxylase-like metal-dependent hydrolase (beta-lactamase superfamily II)